MMNEQCIFCRIAAGEIPSAKVYEDEAVLVIMDINPLSPGHLLVIPRQHRPDLFSMSADELGQVSIPIPDIARAIRQVTGADGLNLIQNNGRAAGQLVEHFHIHLIPRRLGDGIFPRWPQGKYQEGEMDRLAQAIREALGPASSDSPE